MSSDSDSEGNLQVDLTEVKIERESEDDEDSRDPLSLEQASTATDKTEGYEIYADTASLESSCDPLSPGERTRADVTEDPLSAAQIDSKHNVPTLIGLLGKNPSLLGKRPATPTTSPKGKGLNVKQNEDAEDGDNRGRRKYTCLRCGFMTNLDSELRDHMTSLHPEGLREEVVKKVHKDPVTKTFKCDVCNKYFPQTTMLEKHKAYEHPNTLIKIVLPQKTPVAKKLSASRASSKPASKKMGDSETMEKPKETRQPLACDKCSYTAYSSALLVEHQKAHVGKVTYSCDECDYTTIYESTLKIHCLSHTGEKPFSCDVCHYKSSQLRLLRRHKKRRHMGIEKCDSTTEEKESVEMADAATSVDFPTDKKRLFITGDS